jgi:hypothetical protein
MSPARRNASVRTERPRSPISSEVGVWEVADGVWFSVLSSMVLWGILITGLYHALK